MIPSFAEFVSFCIAVTIGLSEKLELSRMHVSYKKDNSPVTSLDLEIEFYIRKVIEDNFPSHSIRGEEFEVTSKDTKLQWIIDPIDGTFSLISGCPLFGTLLALCVDGVPRYGYMNLPFVNKSELYGDNKSAFLNGKPVGVRDFPGWDKSLILTTDQQTIINSPAASFWQNALSKGAVARTWGDCFGYYLLCTGHADMMADTSLKEVDILPLLPILYGAGAVCENFGNPQHKDIIACSKQFLVELLV